MSLRFVIITPSRNQVALLKRCVASVRDQFEEGPIKVTHWVIDAASTDGTVDWLKAEGVSHISEPDRGMYDALNKGLQMIRGMQAPAEIIWAWLNADEQYLPNALSVVAKACIEHPGVDLWCGDALVVNSSGELLTFWKSLPLRRSYLRTGTLYNLSCAMFFRESALKPGIQFDPLLTAVADHVFVCQLMEAGVRSACLENYVAAYTYAPTNLSNQAEARLERQAYQRSQPLFWRGVCPFVRGVRASERLWRGTRREKFPLHYALYTASDPVRRTFSSPRVPARWPAHD